MSTMQVTRIPQWLLLYVLVITSPYFDLIALPLERLLHHGFRGWIRQEVLTSNQFI